MRPLVRRVDRLQRLAVFEAAARLGSFTAAGNELGMTQPAVTRQIRSLERALGIELFRRTSNRSELTESGVRLLDSVDVAFATVEFTLDEVATTSDTFVLASPPGFAQELIVPYLDSLQEALPDRDIRLWLYDRERELTSATFDAAILVGRGAWPGLDGEELFRERVVPIATPAFADEWGLDETSTADDVLPTPLLHMDSRDRPWMSWEEWFAAFDITLIKRPGTLILNNYPAMLQRAIAGRGVALGWRGIVDELLATEVMTVVGPEVESDSSYWIAWPRRRGGLALTALMNWLRPDA